MRTFCNLILCLLNFHSYLLIILFHRTRFSRPTGTSLLMNNWITVVFFLIYIKSYIIFPFIGNVLKTPRIKPWIEILLKLRFKKKSFQPWGRYYKLFSKCAHSFFSCFLWKLDEAINISRSRGWLAKVCNNARRTVSKVQKRAHQKLNNEVYNLLSLIECAQKII